MLVNIQAININIHQYPGALKESEAGLKRKHNIFHLSKCLSALKDGAVGHPEP